jgi:hypothetical protein
MQTVVLHATAVRHAALLLAHGPAGTLAVSRTRSSESIPSLLRAACRPVCAALSAHGRGDIGGGNGTARERATTPIAVPHETHLCNRPHASGWRRPRADAGSDRAVGRCIGRDRGGDPDNGAAVDARARRARYDAERARRQYNAAEPENRLLARSLSGSGKSGYGALTRLNTKVCSTTAASASGTTSAALASATRKMATS